MSVIEIDWTEEITEEDFIDILNDTSEDVVICGMTMQQGDILYKCDNIAFREAYNNYIDGEETERGKYKCLECFEIYQDIEDARECCNDEDGEEQ
jgi:hypothetical protein